MPGAVVVDNSSQWRMHEDVPLVVSEVNPEALDGHKGIVANPNCTTMQTVVALGPILRHAGIERIVMSSYQAVSGTGQSAVEELHDQVEAQLHGQGDARRPPSIRTRSPSTCCRRSRPSRTATTTRPRSASACARRSKILGAEDIGVSATCARVPVFTGHSVSANVQTRDPLSPEECRELLAGAPGLTVIDDPANGLYPTALDAAGRDDVLVGRIRRDPSHERCLNLWIVGNNLRKGAATNAVQVAELLNVRGLLRAAPRRLGRS